MGDPLVLRLWAGRALYLLIACVIIFARLLPLGLAGRVEELAPRLHQALVVGVHVERVRVLLVLLLLLPPPRRHRGG